MKKFNTLYDHYLKEAGEYAGGSFDATASPRTQGKDLDWGRNSDNNAAGFLGDGYNGKRMDCYLKEPKILDIDSGDAHRIRKKLCKFIKLFKKLSANLG